GFLELRKGVRHRLDEHAAPMMPGDELIEGIALPAVECSDLKKRHVWSLLQMMREDQAQRWHQFLIDRTEQRTGPAADLVVPPTDEAAQGSQDNWRRQFLQSSDHFARASPGLTGASRWRRQLLRFSFCHQCRHQRGHKNR